MRAPENLHAFFESVALSVLVRNGDAHLKNFGMLYRHPGDGDVRLAPVYDVVTTTVYPHYNQRTGAERVDRTLALKLFSGAKARHYPSRADLLRFGKTICLVSKPDEVIDRIASAMSAALAANQGRLEGEYAARLKVEWDQSRLALAPAHVRVKQSKLTAVPDPDEDAQDESLDDVLRPKP